VVIIRCVDDDLCLGERRYGEDKATLSDDEEYERLPSLYIKVAALRVI